MAHQPCSSEVYAPGLQKMTKMGKGISLFRIIQIDCRWQESKLFGIGAGVGSEYKNAFGIRGRRPWKTFQDTRK
jgi:hypothetical protein